MKIIKAIINFIKSKKCLLLLNFLFIAASHTYEIVNETIIVTPGCEGGVLYSKTESGEIPSVSKQMNLNAENNTSTETRVDCLEESR
jgi:hypothetical protein